MIKEVEAVKLAVKELYISLQVKLMEPKFDSRCVIKTKFVARN